MRSTKENLPLKDAMNAADEAKKEMASIQEGNQKVLKEARAEREKPF